MTEEADGDNALMEAVCIPYIQLLVAQELAKLGLAQAFLTSVAHVPVRRGFQCSCWSLSDCIHTMSEQKADRPETGSTASRVPVETEIVEP
jgi:hypothetical protein